MPWPVPAAVATSRCRSRRLTGVPALVMRTSPPAHPYPTPCPTATAPIKHGDLPGKTRMPTTLDTGNTAWLMASTAMVLLMTPGLAFFYGGMVKTKHVLVMLKMSFVCLALVTLLWLAIGYSLAFGK